MGNPEEFVERMYKLGLHDGMTTTFETIRNVIASLSIEGFEFTTEDYEIIERVVIDESITIDEAIKEIKHKYESNKESHEV